MSTQQVEPSGATGDSSVDSERERTVAKLASTTRYLVIAPIAGLFVAAVVLTAVAVVDVVKITIEVIGGHLQLNKTVVGFIEVADIFLLAVVLYIMALGLYELFIDSNLPLPEWLVVRSLEDLKEKLIGVVVVVLAIFFLGRVIESNDPQELLYLGVGIAAVIAALAYFAKSVLLHKSE
ncbi:MAG: YqhA family protein [Coriobacteriia bacterium]